DNYFGFDFRELLEFCRDKSAPVNVVYDIDDFEHAKQFGIVDTENEKIVGFEEKPDEPPSTLASTACYFFTEETVSLFQEYEQHFRETEVPAEKYLDEPGRLIEWAHERTEMYAFSFQGDWQDVGTPKGYLEAVSDVIDGSLIEGETQNCDIGENVVTMEGSELVGVEIENTIVFGDAMIIDSEVRNSIIDSNSEIEEADLNGAVIGSHTTL
ncbi:MAG: sugar phosphate nucleotidyltransferase, partial [Candidatus Nanohaloarchaea archaeon]